MRPWRKQPLSNSQRSKHSRRWPSRRDLRLLPMPEPTRSRLLESKLRLSLKSMNQPERKQNLSLKRKLNRKPRWDSNWKTRSSLRSKRDRSWNRSCNLRQLRSKKLSRSSNPSIKPWSTSINWTRPRLLQSTRLRSNWSRRSSIIKDWTRNSIKRSQTEWLSSRITRVSTRQNSQLSNNWIRKRSRRSKFRVSLRRK